MNDKNIPPEDDSGTWQIRVDKDVINSAIVAGNNNSVSIHNTNFLTPIERLRAFEQTDECTHLLDNPDKIGFTPTLCPILRSVLVAFAGGWLLVQVILASLFTMNFSLPWVLVVIGSCCLLGLVIAQFVEGLSYIPALIKGEYLVEASPVRALPALVIRHSQLFGKINTITLEDSNGERLQPIPHPDIDAAMLSDGDIGVAYLRKDALPGSPSRTAVRLVGFKRCEEKQNKQELDKRTLEHIRRLWIKGDRIQAIREYRQITEASLQEAKDALQKLSS